MIPRWNTSVSEKHDHRPFLCSLRLVAFLQVRHNPRKDRLDQTRRPVSNQSARAGTMANSIEGGSE